MYFISIMRGYAARLSFLVLRDLLKTVSQNVGACCKYLMCSILVKMHYYVLYKVKLSKIHTQYTDIRHSWCPPSSNWPTPHGTNKQKTENQACSTIVMVLLLLRGPAVSRLKHQKHGKALTEVSYALCSPLEQPGKDLFIQCWQKKKGEGHTGVYLCVKGG